MATYSFLDTNCALVGPGGMLNLGAGAAVADEGITIEASVDIDTLHIGADGTPMHSLGADKSGTLTVRLQKTSPVNQKLSAMYAIQTAASATHGVNTMSVSNSHTGDSITCQSVAFKKAPSLTFAKDAGMVEWLFSAGVIDRTLGNGGN